MLKNDYGTMQRVLALDNAHPNAIPIFGGATLAYNHIHAEAPDFGAFVEYLFFAIREAQFRKWHNGIADACRTFCNLCLVDPALVEAYLGIRFETLEEELAKEV